jgi:hypothetical protein
MVKGSMSNTTNMRQETSHKTRTHLISMHDQYNKCYSTLLTEDRIEFIEEEEWDMESTNLKVSDIEVNKVIKNITNGKSSGPGNINLELIKYGGKKVSVMVIKLLNKILQGDNTPQGMETGHSIQMINGSVRIKRHQYHKSIYKDPG